MKLHLGDNMDVLPTLEANSIDACVTDPPYGIGFMGREWDTFKPGVVKQAHRLVKAEPIVSDNPNLNGRRRSPAISPSQIDYNRGIDGQRGFQAWTETWAREVLRVLKPGAHLLVCGAPRSYHRMASGIEDAGFEIRDCIMWVFGSGFPKSHNLEGDWDGWGTALKPAWEPILVARKPLAGTVAANVQVHGTGALNIDACRIAHEVINGGNLADNPQLRDTKLRAAPVTSPFGKEGDETTLTSPLGRWPANLIHDGSEEVVALFPESAGQLADVPLDSRKTKDVYGSYARNSGMMARGDTGSAARFFYCAKTSREDRNEGCEHIQKKPLNWSSGTQSPGTFQADGTDRASQNNHPTVKPTELMRYLCRLVTPPGGVVLDPFMGSGSTGKACAYEGFDFIGIEREPDYLEIAEARIAFGARDHKARTAQMGLPL